MGLSEYGQIVRSHWVNLPKYHPRLQLDAFVVMPNHIHGILVLSDIPVGAGLDEDIMDLTHDSSTQPAPTNPLEPTIRHGIPEIIRGFKTSGAGLDNEWVDITDELSTQPAPTNPSACNTGHGIPEIIRGFKTFSARRINQRRKMTGVPVWQRNYYERIIRNEEALQAIRQYIHNNPLSWWKDQLHPDVPSKREGDRVE